MHPKCVATTVVAPAATTATAALRTATTSGTATATTCAAVTCKAGQECQVAVSDSCGTWRAAALRPVCITYAHCSRHAASPATLPLPLYANLPACPPPSRPLRLPCPPLLPGWLAGRLQKGKAKCVKVACGNCPAPKVCAKDKASGAVQCLPASLSMHCSLHQR